MIDQALSAGCTRKDGVLYGLASTIQPLAPGFFPAIEHDTEIEVHSDGDNWVAYAPIRVSRAWKFERAGRFALPFGGLPSLYVAAMANGACETKTGFELRADGVAETLALFGHTLNVETCLADRLFTISQTRTKLVVQVPRHEADAVDGWDQSSRKGYWTRVYEGPTPRPQQFDHLVRCVQVAGESGSVPDGWYIRRRDGQWGRIQSPRNVLQAHGLTKTEAECVMGELELRAIKRVCIPFAPEYPAPGEWNIGAPQMVYKPQPGKHPHWDMIFDHIGRDLDSTLAANGWTGADYLRAWYACIFREPDCQLPYLFLFGDEDNGKSIYHEAFDLLVTRGVVKADRALTSDFNGELEGAILCVVEEKDIASVPGAHARIKDAVTARTLAIRRLYSDQYQVPNLAHWVQCANTWTACPVFPGDTRITAIFVEPLTRRIAKDVLLARLKDEAPALMHTLLTMPLPPKTGRLRLPVVETPRKRDMQNRNAPPLALAIIELMDGRSEWIGTASTLAQSEPSCPTDIRRLERVLYGLRSHLANHSIAYEFPPKKTEHGKTVRFYRCE